MVLTLQGQHLDAPGWRVRTVGIGSAPPLYPMDVPLQPIWSGSAWFQIPSEMTLSTYMSDYQMFEVYKLDHPITTLLGINVLQTVVSCIQTLHEDFSGPVSASSPARIGETIHTFLTGLRGVEPIQDGAPNPSDYSIAVANPPAMADPQAFNPVFFNLLPGFVGLQQVDLQVKTPSTMQLFTGVWSFGCGAPPVLTP